MRAVVFLLVSVLGPLLILGCTDDSTQRDDTRGFQEEGTLAFVRPDGDTLRAIAIDIADTDAERKRGLMRQQSLGYDRGMLFVFDPVDRGSMWMKNTPLPLDIVFVAPTRRLSILLGARPPSRKRKSRPRRPASSSWRSAPALPIASASPTAPASGGLALSNPLSSDVERAGVYSSSAPMRARTRLSSKRGATSTTSRSDMPGWAAFTT